VGAAACAEFVAYFKSRPVNNGDEIVFSWSTSNTLVTSINGQVIGSIQNEFVAWAMFDYYLGMSSFLAC